MTFRVLAMEPRDYEAWRSTAARDAVAPATPSARRGPQVVLRSTCAACHTIKGAAGQVGPSSPTSPARTRPPVGRSRTFAETWRAGSATRRRSSAARRCRPPSSAARSFRICSTSAIAAVSAAPALERGWQRAPGLTAWVSDTSHRSTGARFVVTGFAFFALAGLAARAMRLQLAGPDRTLIDAETYDQLFSVHGSTMMSVFAV